MVADVIQDERDLIQELSALIDANDGAAVAAFLRDLPPEETPWTLSHVDDDRRGRMFELLVEVEPEFTADLLEHLDDAHAADMMADLEPQVAAAIVDEMDSDEQADVLSEMHEDDAEAILTSMSPEEAIDTRQRMRYDDDTAGGLMITEYLSYSGSMPVEQVAEDLREHSDKYGEYEVRYVYATHLNGELEGVVPMRQLVMTPRGTPLGKLALLGIDHVSVDAHVDELEDLFDRIDFSAVPVVDDAGKLVGVVQRAAVQEARGEQAEYDLAKSGGIVGGEELRTMPTLARTARRLMFLVPIMGLMLISAGVISLFRDTVAQIPVIAAFLPLVAGLCGSGGNQAVAVSMREISLGLIKPSDFWQVAGKEASVAVLNGIVLGTLICMIVWVWEHDLALGLVIGGAVPTTVVFASVLGGGVPLLLRMVKLDPAMASGPAVTTAVDLLSYFTVLVLATLAMSHITAT